jgi:hypothetical protein
MNKKCTKCLCIYVLGVNGTVKGCDKCTGVKRDKDGLVWEKNERVQLRAPIGTVFDQSTWYKVARKDAFRKEGAK